MKNWSLRTLAALVLAMICSLALADDIQGPIESVNQDEQSFTVQGIKFLTTPSTEYDDHLLYFEELKAGQAVIVVYQFIDNEHYATEVRADN